MSPLPTDASHPTGSDFERQVEAPFARAGSANLGASPTAASSAAAAYARAPPTPPPGSAGGGASPLSPTQRAGGSPRSPLGGGGDCGGGGDGTGGGAGAGGGCRGMSGAHAAVGSSVLQEAAYALTYGVRGSGVAFVASEPITGSNTDWVAVPKNTAIVFTREKGGFINIMRAPLVAAPPPALPAPGSALAALAPAAGTGAAGAGGAQAAAPAAVDPVQEEVAVCLEAILRGLATRSRAWVARRGGGGLGGLGGLSGAGGSLGGGGASAAALLDGGGGSQDGGALARAMSATAAGARNEGGGRPTALLFGANARPFFDPFAPFLTIVCSLINLLASHTDLPPPAAEEDHRLTGGRAGGPGAGGAVLAVAVDEASRRLYAACTDAAVRVWDLEASCLTRAASVQHARCCCLLLLPAAAATCCCCCCLHAARLWQGAADNPNQA